MEFRKFENKQACFWQQINERIQTKNYKQFTEQTNPFLKVV